MMKALAPRMPRGCSWVWLSIALMGALGAPAGAQSTLKSDTPAKAEPSEGAKLTEDKEAPAEESPESSVEIFKDPNNEAAIQNTFPELSAGTFNERMIKQVKDMAGGATNLDPDLIKKYVNGMAADLTKHAYIKAVIDPTQKVMPLSKAWRAVREAGRDLVEPMEIARRANNASFLTAYSRELIAIVPKLLENHLLARIEGIIALAQTGSPDAVDIFVKQLLNPKQVIWVKLWAARGITNIVQTPAGNKADILVGKSDAVAKAIAAILNSDDEIPWPVEARLLEAMGGMRIPATIQAQSKAEFAETVARVLHDQEARVEVRAWASWALGMMQIGPAVGRFNFPLVAYYMGDVAANLGQHVVDSIEANPTEAEYYTGLLVDLMYPAFFGQDDYRDSGLLKQPNAARPFVTGVGDHVKKVTSKCLELSRSTKGQRPQIVKELEERLAALKGFLEKSPPTEDRLVPNGRQLPLQAREGNAPANGKVAGAGGSSSR